MSRVGLSMISFESGSSSESGGWGLGESERDQVIERRSIALEDLDAASIGPPAHCPELLC